jgi:hypothetical protein
MSSIDWPPTLRAMAFFGLSDAVATFCISVICHGVSISDILSLALCYLLVASGVIFGIFAWKIDDDRLLRLYCVASTILMPLAGGCCIIIDEDFVLTAHPARKSPAFMFLSGAIALYFALGIIGITKKLPCGDFPTRLLTNPTQMNILILMNLIIGLGLGLIFGLADPEGLAGAADVSRTKVVTTGLLFAAFGLVAGAGFGFYNEDKTQNAPREDSITQALASDTRYDAI